MQYKVIEQGKFKYIEEGEGEPLVLLHGLFGALSNFKDLVEHFRVHYKVIVPLLPLFELDILHTSVGGLAKHVHKFLETRDLKDVHLLGNFPRRARGPGTYLEASRTHQVPDLNRFIGLV